MLGTVVNFTMIILVSKFFKRNFAQAKLLGAWSGLHLAVTQENIP